MKDHYRELSVHGLLPLVAEGNNVRFALLGWDHPLKCAGTPDTLPDAEMDLFVFANDHECRVWASAVLTVGNPDVNVVMPDLKAPSFALLVRSDRKRRSGNTLEDVIDLRNPMGAVNRERVEELGQIARADAMEAYRTTTADKVFRARWQKELQVLEGMVEADWSTTTLPVGGHVLHVRIDSGNGGFPGLGPTYKITRDADGYLAQWEITRGNALEEEADHLAREMGVKRTGLTYSVRFPIFDRDSLIDLAEKGDRIDFVRSGHSWPDLPQMAL